ncbi:MAG TPA: hypothetical protein VFA57_15885 [Pseudolabrys sp.]|nr:hypothetical protein [Pseudolabrys sp.]
MANDGKVMLPPITMPAGPVEIVPLLLIPPVTTALDWIRMPVPETEIAPALEIRPVIVLLFSTLMPVGPGEIVPVLARMPEKDVLLTTMQAVLPVLVCGNGPVSQANAGGVPAPTSNAATELVANNKCTRRLVCAMAHLTPREARHQRAARRCYSRICTFAPLMPLPDDSDSHHGKQCAADCRNSPSAAESSATEELPPCWPLPPRSTRLSGLSTHFP